jgi:hypothetical protein
MKRLWTLLGGVGLIVAGGAIASAQDKPAHQAVTLYAPPLTGDTFTCKAINVSRNKLHIAFALLDDNGDPLPCPGCSPPNPSPAVVVPPGMEAELPLSLGTSDDGYCKVDVSGTGDRNDVRVVLEVQRTRNIPNTTIPVFVFKTVEGH